MGRPGLTAHRKFKRLSRTLDGAIQAGFGTILARGVLEMLWDPAFEAGDPYVGDATDVEARVQWGGREGVLVAALVDAGGEGHPGFLDEGGSPWWSEGKPGTYRIHDLFDHAPKYVKRRVELEEARRANGKTISAIRAEAGRKGAAKRWEKRSNPEATGEQPGGNEPSASHENMANGLAKIPTPAPAPAPAQKQPLPSDEPVRRLEIVDEGGGFDPAPEFPLTERFRDDLAAALARTARHPVGGGRGTDLAVFRSCEAALARLGVPAAVEVCRTRVLDSVARRERQPATLKFFVDAVLGDELTRRTSQPKPKRECIGMDEAGQPVYAEAT